MTSSPPLLSGRKTTGLAWMLSCCCCCFAAWTAASLVSDGGVRRAEAKPGGRRPCLGVPGAARWIASLDEDRGCCCCLGPEVPERVGDGGGGEEGVVEKDEPSKRLAKDGERRR